MKKLLSLTLALALGATLAVPALAADLPEGWTPADGARVDLAAPETVDAPVGDRYAASVTVDGQDVDVFGVPGAPAGYVPMRRVCEVNGDYVDWFREENQGFFFFDNHRILVNFSDLSVLLENEPVDGVKAYLDPRGYTFLPVSFLAALDTVTVDDHPELSVERYDLKTSASDPVVMLSNEIAETCEMPMLSRTSLEELVAYFRFTAENYQSIVANVPLMNTMSATVIIATPAEGKEDAAKADLQQYLDQMISTFETYMGATSGVMAKNGQIVESPDGAHLMLIISDHNDKAIELFNAAFPAN